MSPSPPYVQQIQEALGPAWQALLAQQRVIAVEQLVMAAVFAVLMAACIRVAEGPRRSIVAGDDPDSDGLLICAVLYVLTAILGVFGVLLALDGIGHLVNPAGYAVEGIISGLGHVR